MSIILKLKEITPERLAVGIEKLLRASDDFTIVERFKNGQGIETVLLESERDARIQTYQILMFLHFAFCECKDFKFSGSACKHLAYLIDPLCIKYRKVKVDLSESNKCDKCEQEDALYLKPTSEKPVEKIGNIRI